MENNKDKKQNNNKLTILLFILLLIAICIVIGLFAMARYTKDDEHIVNLKFKKAVVEEQNITYTPTTKTKTVKVTIENEGKVQYKIGESGTWTDYTGEFEVAKNDDVYAKLVFSDGEGPVTVKKIENILEEPRVTINAQDMITKERIINAIRWCE